MQTRGGRRRGISAIRLRVNLGIRGDNLRASLHRAWSDLGWLDARNGAKAALAFVTSAKYQLRLIGERTPCWRSGGEGA